MAAERKFKLRIVEPQVEIIEKKDILAPRVPSLRDKVIGYLKGGGPIDFWNRFDELLKQKCQPRDTILKIKPRFNVVATDDEVAELKSRCDVVITGICL